MPVLCPPDLWRGIPVSYVHRREDPTTSFPIGALFPKGRCAFCAHTVTACSRTSSAFSDPPLINLDNDIRVSLDESDCSERTGESSSGRGFHPGKRENRKPSTGWKPQLLQAGSRYHSTNHLANEMTLKSGAPWKMPPLAKIYEAFGALADGRVQFNDQSHASVQSSDGSKTYQVEISADARTVASNDNASYWQGYLGYPAIAVMLRRDLCPVRAEIIDALAGIPWKELNRRFRNDYDRTIEEMMRLAQERGIHPALIAAEAEKVLVKLKELAPLRGSRSRPPRPAGSVSHFPRGRGRGR
jgi:hypothetical protein